MTVFRPEEWPEAEWLSGVPGAASVFSTAHVSMASAAACLALFSPDFIEHEGFVVPVHDIFDERKIGSIIASWRSQPQIAQAQVSSRSLLEVFGEEESGRHVPDAVLDALGTAMAASWERALREQLPDAPFRARVIPFAEDGWGTTVDVVRTTEWPRPSRRWFRRTRGRASREPRAG
ncbi:hypothetical protein GXB85_11140 [Cellulomonas sp. APG4]|uniref:hypothetical protein n=1 Tax=Cellulomonas sp. APG4 TaxID=1538656 RepID=UPI00137B26DC|nr:hypothetical protein [Cellulomonas sp. APG4]NCT91502.1 hypothetical protein [Cellulomonas sp. APG4]